MPRGVPGSIVWIVRTSRTLCGFRTASATQHGFAGRATGGVETHHLVHRHAACSVFRRRHVRRPGLFSTLAFSIASRLTNGLEFAACRRRCSQAHDFLRFHDQELAPLLRGFGGHRAESLSIAQQGLQICALDHAPRLRKKRVFKIINTDELTVTPRSEPLRKGSPSLKLRQTAGHSNTMERVMRLSFGNGPRRK